MTEKKWKKYLAAGLLIASVGLVTVSQSQTVLASNKDTKTVVAATGGQPKPFTYVDSKGKLTGHNIELLKAVFKKLPQYKLKIVKTEFSSIFTGISSGRYQLGVNNIAKNAEREANYAFTDPIFKNSYVAIFKKGSKLAKSVNSWDDLAGHSTVGSTGVNTSTAIEAYNKEHSDKQITLNYSAEDLKAQLQGVESGKYDFLLMDKPMFEYYQKEYDMDLVGKDVTGDLADVLMGEPYSYFVAGKDDTQLVKDVNKALKEVVEDGTSKKINVKYFGSDYSPTYDK
ncbi:transporter substrate-binding domain-containing protein [Streptococcus sp. HF-1907]|uniref:transporter substrate-binding domain-containing protein n=1 Tax=Streptococcus sp. HF-1907 TaxID=2785793 RepID=UPI00189F87FA|nr:transporter substrate-binding domain-containing protein [Streptococcus sp. HF-1907]MBF7094130.1 transporter substrate-binding domain-containing protein [Streptococcus sp. HF-1907]